MKYNFDSWDVTSIITAFVREYQDQNNTLTSWKTPLVGFASVDDPFFEKLPAITHLGHSHPLDLFPGGQTVIAFFLPFFDDVGRSNAKDRLSSDKWCSAYIETNELVKNLGDRLQSWFKTRGWESLTFPATHNWDEKTLISDWSHRHVAYIAGLGTFGINNMLITSKGCDGRFGTFVTSASLKPSTLQTEEACLYKYDGTCGVCVKKCVNGALTHGGFDRFKCYEMCLENEKEHRHLGYADVCGKCLSGIPCASGNPAEAKRMKKR